MASLIKGVTVIAGNVSTLLSLGYTTIEVWGSVDDGGTWAEITAPVAAAATLDSSVFLNTKRVGGYFFGVSVDGTPVQFINFDSTLLDWTADQVRDRINEVIPGLASVVDRSVRLTSPTTGRASTLSISSDATLIFGSEARGVGKDSRLSLSSGSTIYQYLDVASSLNIRYKWRFSNNGASPLSEFSPYTQGLSTSTVDSNRVSIATSSFIGSDGRGVRRSVIVSVTGAPNTVEGHVVVSDQVAVHESDNDGFLQIPLLRGVQVRVAIEGMTLIREFVVPDQPTFDLLQTMAAAPDAFDIQPTTPLITRRHI